MHFDPPRHAYWVSLGRVFQIATFFVVLCFSFYPTSTRAAANSYEAMIVSVSAPQTLPAGQAGSVTVIAKNIGRAAWEKDGKHFFSLYRWDAQKKVEVASAFSSPAWDSDRRPMRLPVAMVQPGQSVTLSFPLHAPLSSGLYHEDFTFAAEGVAWIRHSNFGLDVSVTDRPTDVGRGMVFTPQSIESTGSIGRGNPAPTPIVDWSGALIDKGGSEWQIDVQDHVLATLAFKNTGKKIWTRDGTNYVSIYATDGIKERKSLFKDFHWLGATQAVKLKEAQVKPGEVGHFLLELRAPSAPGSYQETFTLAAENTSWVAGTNVTFPIRVPLTSEFIATAPPGQDLNVTPPPSAHAISSPGIYQTILLLRSATALSLAGDQHGSITLGFKNTGKIDWNSWSMRVTGVQSALAGSSAYVRDESWINPTEAVHIQGTTKPGEIGFVTFQLKAPPRRGSYQVTFQLYTNDEAAQGGEVDIPITVTADGADANATSNYQLPAPNSIDVVPLGGDISRLPDEPLIRVGLFQTTDDQMMVRAKFAPLTIQQNGQALCHLATGQLVTIRFDRANRVYKMNGDGSCVGQSTDPYIVKLDDGISPMEIADYSRPIAWLAGSNDNTFRAQLELRYAPSTNNIWVINMLPLEMYLRGIAETSDQSPYEYQKALLTAARTYAMYHLQKTAKHANEFFTIDAHYDQVYRGYGAEARGPSITSAVAVTRGQIVTYQEKLAITPYYSRSDGRTRAWTEVWGGGPFPWLISVPVPWDRGRTLWGHGIGMSATGALGMANDGKRYDEILKYFYQGTDLRRAYK